MADKLEIAAWDVYAELARRYAMAAREADDPRCDKLLTLMELMQGEFPGCVA